MAKVQALIEGKKAKYIAFCISEPKIIKNKIILQNINEVGNLLSLEYIEDNEIISWRSDMIKDTEVVKTFLLFIELTKDIFLKALFNE